MAKVKNPVISLGGKGTIGDTITLQRSRKQDIVRTKPIPAYRNTLPQQYQRWLYEDYAYLWRQQTELTRRQYAASGSRLHLTGFQYWMKYNLTNLPDIIGWWRMDRVTGATTFDSGKNAKHATVIGATSVAGLIDYGYYFDGINDRLVAPTDGTLNPSGAFTIEALVNPDTYTGVGGRSRGIAGKKVGHAAANPGFELAIWDDPSWGFLGCYLSNGVIQQGCWTGPLHKVPANQWTHIALVFIPSTSITLYFNGVQRGQLAVGVIAAVGSNASWFIMGWSTMSAIGWQKGILDNLIFYNRPLDTTELLRHAERRYIQ